MLSEFSLSVTKEMYREEYRDYGYWCLGVKGCGYGNDVTQVKVSFTVILLNASLGCSMKSQKGLQKEHSVSYELWSIKGVPLKTSGIATGDFENVSWFNPFTPKISIIINSNSVFCLPYNSYDVSLENLV